MLEEILMVLESGYHEKRHDQFNEHFQSWNYAVRGRTVDERDLRVIVAFEARLLIFVTAMEVW